MAAISCDCTTVPLSACQEANATGLETVTVDVTAGVGAVQVAIAGGAAMAPACTVGVGTVHETTAAGAATAICTTGAGLVHVALAAGAGTATTVVTVAAIANHEATPDGAETVWLLAPPPVKSSTRLMGYWPFPKPDMLTPLGTGCFAGSLSALKSGMSMKEIFVVGIGPSYCNVAVPLPIVPEFTT